MSENTEKTKKQSRISIEEQIQKMKLVFANAKLPNILQELQKVGYTEEKLNSYNGELSALEKLFQNQKKEYAEQYAETEKLNQKRTKIDEAYRRHLAFCKILFKGNTQANATLGLSEGRKNAYSAWFQQVSNFYGQLLSNSDLKAKVSTINIKEDDLNAQKNALLELSQIKESQAKEMGEAQKATEERDMAFDNLYPKYTELVSYAKVLFDGDQILEQLGITVKRS